MTSPLPMRAAATTLDDEAWEDLLNFIDERRVIPIIGPELLQVETETGPRLLYDWVAEKLAARLNVDTAALPPPYTLNDVVPGLRPRVGEEDPHLVHPQSVLRAGDPA